MNTTLEWIKLRYSSDLTDKEWEMIKPFFTRTKKGSGPNLLITSLPPAYGGGQEGISTILGHDPKKGKHLQKHDKRELVNAIRYIAKTGCQWELLPNDYPNYKTVNSFYVRAKKSGLWEEIMDMLVEQTRLKAQRTAKPSYSLIDSQSTKTIYASEERGIDGGKKS
jgi:transposase